MKKYFIFLLVLLLTVGCSGSTTDSQMKFGNPSQATTNINNKNNYLMKKKYFSLSYNSDQGTPNWVSWRLAKEDMSDVDTVRPTHFLPDQTLPSSFKKVEESDYRNSGFDRGHMCPHSDRNRVISNESTFIMTNIIPQAPNNNQRAWNALEIYCRDLVTKDNNICYIISGPYGEGGTGKHGFKRTISKKDIVVPSKTWKVILALKKDVDQPQDLKNQNIARLIAVIMPNDQTPGPQWSSYRVPLEEIENLTGYTFFDQAPEDVIKPLKTKVDDVFIPEPQLPDRTNRK